MPLEIATTINQLNTANPLGSDPIAAGDDHIRLIKSTLKNTFPNVTGPVTVTQDTLNNVATQTYVNNAIAGFTTTGRVVQTVQTVGSVGYSTSTSYQATGHTATITPTSVDSKILVMMSCSLWQTNGYGGNSFITLYRNGTNLFGSRDLMVLGGWQYDSAMFQYLDSPNTTSAVTYQPYIRADSGGTTAYGGTNCPIITLLEIL